MFWKSRDSIHLLSINRLSKVQYSHGRPLFSWPSSNTITLKHFIFTRFSIDFTMNTNHLRIVFVHKFYYSLHVLENKFMDYYWLNGCWMRCYFHIALYQNGNDFKNGSHTWTNNSIYYKYSSKWKLLPDFSHCMSQKNYILHFAYRNLYASTGKTLNIYYYTRVLGRKGITLCKT